MSKRIWTVKEWINGDGVEDKIHIDFGSYRAMKNFFRKRGNGKVGWAHFKVYDVRHGFEMSQGILLHLWESKTPFSLKKVKQPRIEWWWWGY